MGLGFVTLVNKNNPSSRMRRVVLLCCKNKINENWGLQQTTLCPVPHFDACFNLRLNVNIVAILTSDHLFRHSVKRLLVSRWNTKFDHAYRSAIVMCQPSEVSLSPARDMDVCIAVVTCKYLHNDQERDFPCCFSKFVYLWCFSVPN